LPADVKKIEAIASLLQRLESKVVPSDLPHWVDPPDYGDDEDAIDHGWLPIERCTDFPEYLVVVNREPYLKALKLARAQDDAALESMGFELLRPFDSKDRGLHRKTAVLRTGGVVVQLRVGRTRHSESDIGRVGAIQMACGLIGKAIGDRVGVADLAAALHPGAADAMEKTLRRLNSGKAVHRTKLVGIGWQQVAFTHPTFREPGARQRRKAYDAKLRGEAG